MILIFGRSGRPCRVMLDRDEDMLATGTRHPFLGRWKVGFNSDVSFRYKVLNILVEKYINHFLISNSTTYR